MSITTPTTKPVIDFQAGDFKSFINMSVFIMSAQKIMNLFSQMQINKKTRSWALGQEANINEQRSEALKKIKSFENNQYRCYLYSDLNSECGAFFDLSLKNLELSSLPPFLHPLKITQINLSGNQLLDLSQLQTLENITHLYLTRALQTPNIDLSALEKLQVVHLEENGIENLETIKLPKQKIRIILDQNLIQTIPQSWLEIHPESEVSLHENPLDFSTKKTIIERFIKMLGPKLSFKIENIDFINSNLNTIPPSIKFFEDGLFVISLRFNKIEQIPEAMLSSNGLYVIDLRNNPLDYETKSKIKKIQRDCKQDFPAFPLILFDQYTKSQKIPTQENLQNRFVDLQSFLKLYQEQVKRDS